eukprot:m.134947 g.134947  ORF g.134947 m.134947 type:complete len:308 (+) comp9790_c0_seq1:168-1091(+)
MSTHRGTDGAFGDLAERRKKMDARYDNDVEKIHIAFIEANTGSKFSGNFQAWLKDGSVLCNLMNALQPGSIKGVYDGGMAFKQMENISKFLACLPQYGVRVEDAFQTPDLYESVNMSTVQQCIESVRRISELKKKGVQVDAQTPTRKQVSLPSGSKKLGEASTPAKKVSLASGPTYASEQSESAEYGDLAERRQKLASKYDKDLEKSLRSWIEEKTGLTLEDDFHAALRDGTALCKLVNALKPGSVARINDSKMAFKQMENINNFLEACKGFGVRTNDLFQTVALYEAENMVQVLQTIDNLKRIVAK